MRSSCHLSKRIQITDVVNEKSRYTNNHKLIIDKEFVSIDIMFYPATLVLLQNVPFSSFIKTQPQPNPPDGEDTGQK